MVNKDAFQKYLDAGISFTTITRARAEELVQELVKSGEFQSSDARAKVDELIERSRKGSEAFAAQVRTEVSHQLDAMGVTNIEELSKQVAAFLSRTADAGRAATADARSAAQKATKAAAKRAPGKKSAAKKSAAKKAPAKKECREEGPGQEGPRQEDCCQEEPGQEECGQEGSGQEDCRQEGSGRRLRVGRLTRSARRRLDRALVDRGLVETRAQAVALIERGAVLVSGSMADKAARLVAADEPIELSGPPPRFVGRGGEKLQAALDGFAINPAGLRALDAGASTGGFTDCLLQAGASSVVAVDVGHGQLHQRLRSDPRVTNLERQDVRHLTTEAIGGTPVDLVTADLSFISVTRAVPVLVGELVVPGAPVVILVKPQFEAGRIEASRGRGIIRDPEVHRRVLSEVTDALQAAGAVIMGAMPSPITGSAGNVEYLLHARTDSGSAVDEPGATPETSALVDAAVSEAHRLHPSG